MVSLGIGVALTGRGCGALAYIDCIIYEEI